MCMYIYLYLYSIYTPTPIPIPKALFPKPDPTPRGQVRFLFAKIIYKFASKPTTPKLVNTTAIYYMVNSHPV